MAPRIPQKSDFPNSLTLTIVPPSQSHPPTNILLLLHGLGDTHIPFSKLGQQLSLPETACLSLQAPNLLPFDLGGFQWGDDLVMDESGEGGVEMDTGFEKATKTILEDVVRGVLVDKCGYRLRDVVLFGYGQGGLVALSVAAKLSSNTSSSSSNDNELGGVIGIGAFLPSTSRLPPVDGKKFPTPVLICKGSTESAVTEAETRRLKDAFAAVEVVKWKKRGDGMPANREEMLPIMRFFARRLRSIRGVPEGAVEIR